MLIDIAAYICNLWCKYFYCKIYLLLIKKVMLGELFYIFNGEKINRNKRKNVFLTKWEDRIAKKVTETRACILWLAGRMCTPFSNFLGTGLTMLITICSSLLLLRSIQFYIVTEHYHPNTQCRIGLISEVIVIGIYSDQHHQSYMTWFQSLFFAILSSNFFSKAFLRLLYMVLHFLNVLFLTAPVFKG